MLRTSANLLGGAYHKRVMHLPKNHQRPIWLAPRRPLKASPIANKFHVDGVKNLEDQKRGIEWYNRTRRRKEYAHWPFTSMKDDNIRRHKNADDAPSRSFSLKDSACKAGMPEWNYYASTARDYQTASDCPVHYLAEFISLFTAKVWSKAEIEAHLKKLEGSFKTIADVATANSQVVSHQRKLALIPEGLLAHTIMCANDVHLYNKRRDYRHKMQKTAILRDRLMGRYYALPYLLKPQNVEVAQKPQPLGVYPEGDYLITREKKKYFHYMHSTRSAFIKYD